MMLHRMLAHSGCNNRIPSGEGWICTRPHRSPRLPAWPCKCSLYKFAESQPRTDTGASRNRGREKKEAQQVLDLVRGLVGMNRKQLAAVSHLLNDEQLEHLRLAARLPITNQGRKREENLVAKLLRAEEDEATLEKLSVAVKLAEDANVYMDEDAEELLTAWREGLLEDDQAVVQEVYSLAESNALDTQRLRQLVLQCRQAAQQLADAQPSTSETGISVAAAASSSGSQAYADPELEEIMRTLPAGKKVKGLTAAGGSGSTASTKKQKQRSSESTARRAISKLLRPLALQVAQQRAGAARDEEEAS